MSGEPQVISKPDKKEYPEKFSAEIELAHYDDLIDGLRDSLEVSFKFLSKLSPEQQLHRYEKNKWSVKEIWQHIIDVERILGYRALCYSRKDETVLPGFDHNNYVINSAANDRDWDEMLEEYSDVRVATMHLFNSFDKEMLLLKGTAGSSQLSVRAVGFLILGHNIHHLNTVHEKYIGSA